MSKNIISSLSMDKLIFDIINFERTGLKNSSSEFEMNLEVIIGINNKIDSYKVTLKMLGTKENEYKLNISVSGYFSINSESEPIDDKLKKDLIEKNAVAIMMPYLRSQISLITAQPDVDCVVLPPLNINNMIPTDKTN